MFVMKASIKEAVLNQNVVTAGINSAVTSLCCNIIIVGSFIEI